MHSSSAACGRDPADGFLSEVRDECSGAVHDNMKTHAVPEHANFNIRRYNTLAYTFQM